MGSHDHVATHAKTSFCSVTHTHTHNHTGRALQLKVSGKQNGAALRLLASAVWLAIVQLVCSETACDRCQTCGLLEGSEREPRVSEGDKATRATHCPHRRGRPFGEMSPAFTLKSLKLLQPGKCWAAQKDDLYLERGPGRYVLAWSVSGATSIIDGEEETRLNKNAQMSNAGSRERSQIQPRRGEIQQRDRKTTSPAVLRGIISDGDSYSHWSTPSTLLSGVFSPPPLILSSCNVPLLQLSATHTQITHNVTGVKR